MWIEYRKRERLRTGSEFPSDHVERRSVGDFPALVRRYDVTGRTPHLGKPFAVIGIGGERGRSGQERRKHQEKAKQLHVFLRPSLAIKADAQ